MSETEQAVTLLPCPLADKGNAVFTENGFFFGIGYGVKCDDCGLWLDSRARTREAAAALWNTRDSMADKEQQEHPYFIHARECQTCGPAGFCAEGLRLYTTTCDRDSSHAPQGDEAFTAYNQAIQDALAAIRAESQGGGYWAATHINAIARKCSPHVYVASLAVTAPVSTGEQPATTSTTPLNRVRAEAIVGTVFDDTAASHETLKRTMIQRIENYFNIRSAAAVTSTRFNVGDKLRNIHASYLPTATVTEITERGFRYELERPFVISPRLGTQTGGESYEDSQWELVAEPPAATEAGEQERERHPEDFCEKCGRPNIVWFAPNALWNQVVRAASEPEILCPVCFVQLAEAAGVSAVWEVAPQNYHADERKHV